METKIDWHIVVCGMICLTIAELYAISQGINGTLLLIFVGIMATAMGIAIPKEKIIK